MEGFGDPILGCMPDGSIAAASPDGVCKAVTLGLYLLCLEPEILHFSCIADTVLDTKHQPNVHTD